MLAYVSKIWFNSVFADAAKQRRVISSVGRASALQAECRRFDSVITHHFLSVALTAIGCAVVAQLVRVLACHASGRGFEPRPPRQSFFHCIIRSRFHPLSFLKGFLFLYLMRTVSCHHPKAWCAARRAFTVKIQAA